MSWIWECFDCFEQIRFATSDRFFRVIPTHRYINIFWQFTLPHFWTQKTVYYRSGPSSLSHDRPFSATNCFWHNTMVYPTLLWIVNFLIAVILSDLSDDFPISITLSHFSRNFPTATLPTSFGSFQITMISQLNVNYFTDYLLMT